MLQKFLQVVLKSVSLQKKTSSEVLKNDIFFIVHFGRQTNGGGLNPKPPLRTPLTIDNQSSKYNSKTLKRKKLLVFF